MKHLLGGACFGAAAVVAIYITDPKATGEEAEAIGVIICAAAMAALCGVAAWGLLP